MNRAWVLAAALGILVAAASWPIDDQAGHGGAGDGDGPGGSSSATGTSTPPPAVLNPFPTSWGLAGTNATFLVVAPDGQDAALEALNRSPSRPQAAQLDWVGGNEARGVEHRLAYYSTPHLGCPEGAPCPAAGDPGLLPAALADANATQAPRFGVDGYNATRATVYVFDARGLLLFTNDAPGNWSEFQGPPTEFAAEVWYLGEKGSAPNGTKPVPSFARSLLPQLRPALTGTPVGAVVSAQSNAYASFYGTVFITARIDELVYAP